MSEKTSSAERRITIPKDIWTSLTYFANAEKVGINPAIADAINPESMTLEILRNTLKQLGHYPLKTGKEVEVPDMFSKMEIE